MIEDLGMMIPINSKTHRKYRYAKFLCDCKNKKIIQWNNVRNGNVQSCGCLQSETSSENVKIMQEKNIAHGDSIKGSKQHSLYARWVRMRQRCYSPNSDRYEWYGGLGIKICDEWDSYPVYKEWALNNGYRQELTIDRIDVLGDYEPSNCQWITAQENIDKEYTIDRDRQGRSRGGSYQ